MKQKYIALALMGLFILTVYSLNFWATGFATFSGDIELNETVDQIKMVEKGNECDQDTVLDKSVSDGEVTIEANGLRIPYTICLYSDGEIQDKVSFTALDHQIPSQQSTFQYGNQTGNVTNVGIVW